MTCNDGSVGQSSHSGQRSNDARNDNAESSGWGQNGSTESIPSPVSTILIAPSWQEDNLLDLCINDMLEQLIAPDRRVIVRPHPEYIKRFGPRWEALQKRWGDTSDEQLHFEGDFSSNESIYTSDVLITDWSSISCEFSFSTLKPCIFIDTPMKERNTTWRDWNMEPTDITLRNKIGVSFAPDALDGLSQTVDSMISHPDDWSERIKDIRDGFIFNLGHGGKIAGEYLLSAVLEKQEARGKQ